MGTTPHFTRGKSGKLRPDGLNALAQGSDIAPDHGSTITSPERVRSSKDKFFPIVAMLVHYVKSSDEEGGAQSQQTGLAAGGYMWDELIFDKDTRTWEITGRRGVPNDDNLAYPIGLTMPVGGTEDASQIAQSFTGHMVLLHNFNDRNGKPYLGFQPSMLTQQDPGTAFVGEIIRSSSASCALQSSNVYDIQPLKVADVLQSGQLIFDADPTMQIVEATNTLEHNGGYLGGSVSGESDDSCNIVYTYTPIPNGQRVVVHKRNYQIGTGGDSLEGTAYFFTCPLEVCMDCCSDGLYSNAAQRDAASTRERLDRSTPEMIGEMLR